MAISPFMTCPATAFGKPVARLGLASHLKTSLTPDDVLHGIHRGIGFINWLGFGEENDVDADPFPQAIAQLGERRGELVVCVQFGSRTVAEARDELKSLLSAMRTDYIDVLTLYYVQERDEWDELCAPGGVLEFCQSLKRDGIVRRIGVTSHQRKLAATMAESGKLDLLMIRYNAAHRGAERDIFPVTSRLKMPVIAYTATRWGALMKPTRDDPPGFDVPPAAEWYRFVLQNAAVSLVLSAPHTRSELDHDLTVLGVEGPLDEIRCSQLADHGDRVRRHAGQFA